MKTNYKFVHFTAFAFAAVVLFSCKKEEKLCKIKFVEITGQNHLVDMQAVNQVQEFSDTLAKYPHLQVHRIIDDQYQFGMHCNLFHEGLPVFSDQYGLTKSKSTGEVSTINQPPVVSIQISLTPTLDHSDAIDIAKDVIDFKKTCRTYRLGIFNVNAGTGVEAKAYKLVWKIQGDNGNRYVILDAHSGEVYRQHDGIYN